MRNRPTPGTLPPAIRRALRLAAGVVAGLLLTAGSAVAAPVCSIVDLGTFGELFSDAFGINDAGQIVGHATNAANQLHAFLFDGVTMFDLNDLIDLGDPLFGRSC